MFFQKKQEVSPWNGPLLPTPMERALLKTNLPDLPGFIPVTA